jgi:type IX secretion system PorP/SprF family membrane protein
MFDQTGAATQAHFQLNYAYHIPLDYDKINLSFGLGAKVKYYSLDFKSGDLPPVADPAFDLATYDKTSSDASSGVYLYGKDFYAGFSISNMFQSIFNTTFEEATYYNMEYRTYYGMGGYRMGIVNNDWELEPSFLIRKMQFHSSIVDVTTRIHYLDDTWAGLTYRNNGTAIFALGFKANNLHLSYSYDHTLAGEIMQYNYGTHEIGITFKIKTLASQRHIGFWSY